MDFLGKNLYALAGLKNNRKLKWWLLFLPVFKDVSLPLITKLRLRARCKKGKTFLYILLYYASKRVRLMLALENRKVSLHFFLFKLFYKNEKKKNGKKCPVCLFWQMFPSIRRMLQMLRLFRVER